MKGLIIKEKWLNLILAGKKTWEIRNNTTTKVGTRIGLIKSGSGKVFGECDLVASIPLTKEKLLQNIDKHHISKESINLITYKNPHAWVLSNVKKYTSPVLYKHKNGSVIWVNI